MDVATGLHSALTRAGIPVLRVEIGDPSNRATWVVSYAQSATSDQVAAGETLRATYDPATDTAYLTEYATREFDNAKATKAVAIWTAQKLNVPLATMRSEVIAIFKTLALVLLLTAPASAQTVRTVCAAGCTYTNSAANIQTAINASVGGDSVLLQAGFTYDVALTLPSHTGASMVTIRTGVTSTGTTISAGAFPSANIRMTPALATSSNLATLRALTNNTPAIRTTDAIGSGGYWTLKHLAVTGNTYGGEALIQLGSDSNNAGEQDSIARIPANFTLEQLYVYGNPVSGQFRGIRTHANTVTIKDSSIANIKSTSEGQAIYANSFSTGLTITNNYIEGGAEGILFGGAGGCCHPTVTVSSATNASTFVVSDHTDAFVGLGISVEIGGSGSAFEQWTEIASCGTSTPGAACTSNNFTVSPALSTTPSGSADVDWGVVPSNITIEKNYLYKPPAWRDPIVGTPQSVSAASAETGGTLAAGTYYYRVVARHPAAVNTTAVSTASVEVNAIVAGSTGKVTVTWVPVTNATEYRVYGRNAGGENMYWTVTSGSCAATCSYADTGTTGTTGNVPTGSGTVWYIKNILELKNARLITINGNVFDGIWSAAQTGYAIVFTPANTGHGNDSTTVEDVTFTNNWIRNAAGVWQITGRDVSTTSGGQISGRLERVTIQNNLATGISSSWGASLRSILISTTGPQTYYPNNTASNGPLDLVRNHNTIIHTSGNAPIWYDLFKTTEQPVENPTETNNIQYKLSSGVTGGNSCSQGNGCWLAHTSGTRVWGGNVVVDASCGSYPSGTFCPTSAQMITDHFVDAAAGNYRIKSTSAYHNAGTDGADIGVNYTTLTALTDIALSGDNTGGTPIVPPSITTLSLADGQRNATYTADIVGVCNATPCSWSSTGTLPTGLSLSTVSSTLARLSGTLTTAGTFTPTLTITDSGGRTGSQGYSITVSEVIAPPDENPPTRPDRFNFDERVMFGRATDPKADGEPTRNGDLWSNTGCSSTVINLLESTSPTDYWRPLAFRARTTPTTITTAGVVTYTAAELIGGLILRDPNGGNRSDVTPTAALIVAAIPCAGVSDSFEFDIRNTADAAETITITAGTGVTLSGTMTIAQNNTRRFRAVVTNVTAGTEAVTVYSLGTFVH